MYFHDVPWRGSGLPKLGTRLKFEDSLQETLPLDAAGNREADGRGCLTESQGFSCSPILTKPSSPGSQQELTFDAKQWLKSRLQRGYDRHESEWLAILNEKRAALVNAKKRARLDADEFKAAAYNAEKAAARAAAMPEGEKKRGAEAQAGEAASIAHEADVKARRAAAAADVEKAEFDKLQADWMMPSEASPSYLPTGDFLFDAANHSAKLRQYCRACGGSHTIAVCHCVFEDMAALSTHFKRIWESRCFEERMQFDSDFREAITYLRESFRLGLTSADNSAFKRYPIRDTRHAPPSAIGLFPGLPSCPKEIDAVSLEIPGLLNRHYAEYLMQFSADMKFWKTSPHDFGPWVNSQATILQGYYSTADDDGWPLVILFINSAPDVLEQDPVIMHEIGLIRTFVTKYRKGYKVRSYQFPHFAEPD